MLRLHAETYLECHSYDFGYIRSDAALSTSLEIGPLFIALHLFQQMPEERIHGPSELFLLLFNHLGDPLGILGKMQFIEKSLRILAPSLHFSGRRLVSSIFMEAYLPYDASDYEK